MDPDAPQSAAALAWDLAGRPRLESLPDGPPGDCAACGTAAAETVPAARVLAGGFTDHKLLADPHGTAACYPCAWALAGKPPDTLRMWTVACAPGRDLGPSHPKAFRARGLPPGPLLLTARNDMRAVAALLCNPPPGPWCAAVAESGQKHTLPWTSLNHGPGRWHVRMDALDVHATPRELAGVLGHVAALRAAGFPSEAVEHLDPGGRLTAATLPAWQKHAAPLAPWRSSPLMHLAVFLPNKEHSDHYVSAYSPS